MKIIDYDIITFDCTGGVLKAETILELEIHVKGKILEGWQPSGGVAITDRCIMQAMVKYEIPKPFHQ